MTITIDAKKNLISYLKGDSPTSPSHIAIGTDDTAANETDTSLVADVGRYAIASADKISTGNFIDFKVTLSTAQGNGNTIKEIGLFNAATNGTMFGRAVSSGLDKDSSFSVEIIFTVVID